MPPRRTNRSFPFLALLTALCAMLALPAAAQADGKRRASCPGANALPTAANLPAVRSAVLCLHNRDRRARDLPLLREQAQLSAAAAGHSANMVAARFFSHDAPDGSDLVTRVLGTGYASGQGWSLGENIGWATGGLATAAKMHRSWMRSPGHRANILRRGFRELGIGIALGAPVDAQGLNGATYTTDFGVRR